MLNDNSTFKVEIEKLSKQLAERDDMIWDLKSKLDYERKNAKWVQTDKVKRITERNEFEDFFLQCVEEVRKDIVKRKS